MTYNCTCVGEKIILANNEKTYTLLWITLYDDKDVFVDCIKVFSNKSLKGVGLGVRFTAKKGFNKESRETFLYNITVPDTDITI